MEEIYSEIKRETLTDEEFEVVFNTLSIKSVNVAKYVLRKLNDYNSLEVKAITDNSKLHLEHIMPKKLGNWNISEENHNKYLNRIGNLTLLADEYNRAIQNNIFIHKKEIYKRSKLAITNEICEFDEWNENSIQKRQNSMFKLAKKIW